MNEKYIRVELLMDFLDRNARDDLLTPADIGTALEMVPAEDVKPVVHAHWIKKNYDSVDGTIYKCSNCNTEFFNAWNYCPDCGAKMGEEGMNT